MHESIQPKQYAEFSFELSDFGVINKYMPDRSIPFTKHLLNISIDVSQRY